MRYEEGRICMAKIIIDLDGVICNIKKKESTYKDVVPLPGTVEKIKQLKKQGHYIIISTARHMLSTNNNVGLINKKVGKITLDWLDENEIEYDEIVFAKPHGEVYIDDNALHFRGWDQINVEDFDTDLINIVIPMAGRGERFTKAGYEEPKPLIKCFDKYMFEWAACSFDFLKSSEFKIRYTFVILKGHAIEWKLDEIIKDKYPGSVVVIIDEVTGGQAETVLKAKEYINNLNKLIIYNVDTYSLTPSLLETISGLNVDGVIPCFKSNNPRYSFAKSDNNNNVLEVAEKVAISDNASTGLYYFRRGRDFIWAAENMIDEGLKENNEYYVIPVYNKLIELGKIVKVVNCDEYWVLGTPEELESFKKEYKK